jgi:hypothetical protein
VTSGLILNHLLALDDKMKQYFSSLAVNEYDWARNPYAVSPDATTHLPIKKQEQLAELQSDRTLQLKYGELSLPKDIGEGGVLSNSRRSSKYAVILFNHLPVRAGFFDTNKHKYTRKARDFSQLNRKCGCVCRLKARK